MAIFWPVFRTGEGLKQSVPTFSSECLSKVHVFAAAKLLFQVNRFVTDEAGSR